MSNQSVQTVSTSGDKMKVVLAIALVVAGVVGFFYLKSGNNKTLISALPLVGGLLLATLVAWTSTSGREFLNFAKEAVRETKKVVWPTRKEATQITMIVFAFVVVMAIFLWGTDKTLEYLLYDVILGIGKK